MTSGCRVAVVADDLTGALDAAAPFARRGATTRVVISLERLNDALAAWKTDVPAVVAVNTESRHLPAARAAARVAEATETLQALAPLVLFKKIDSTLRGHVVSECLAARRACGRQLLVAPAVPAQGRVVRGGRVYVHGEPLEASAFGRDALSAPPREGLAALFAAQGIEITILPAGRGLYLTDRDYLADAERDADLNALASRLLETPAAWLAVGAAGLASAIARACFTEAVRRDAEGFARVLFVVGSRTPQARRQIACLRDAAPGLAVVSALDGAAPTLPAQTQIPARKSAVLLPGTSVVDTAPQVAARMADYVAGAVQSEPGAQGEGRLLFLTGGDTAMAVMQRLGVHHVEVTGEWDPGVAWGRLDGDPCRPVMTKAGGFGDDALLVRLLRASTTRE